MKKKYLCLFIAPIFLLASCITNKNIAISGDIETKEIILNEPSKLEIYDITIKDNFSTIGPTVVCLNDSTSIKKAVIKTNSDLIDKISIRESGQSLKISASSHEVYVTNSCEIYLYNCTFESIDLDNAVQMIANDGTLREDKLEVYLERASSLEINKLFLNEIDVELSGAAVFTAKQIELNDASFELSGASKVDIASFEADDVSLSLSGASSFTSSGTVDKINVEAVGASRVDMINTNSSKVSGKLSGASSGYFSFRGTLKMNLAGASSLYYLGDSQELDVNATGGSKVRKYQ